MEWNFFTIIDAEHDDPTLFPVLGQQGAALPVELDETDGDDPMFLTASRVTLTRSTRGDYQKPDVFDDLKFEVVITDARVIVYCEKWTKGGGWTGFGLGGVAVALTANAISKARAASRRRGKLLVGQIRYPWLGAVGGSPKIDWKTNEHLRLLAMTRLTPPEGPAAMHVTIRLPKQVDSTAVAAEIAQRSARWRLTRNDLAPDVVVKLEELLQAQPKVPEQRINDKTKQMMFGDHAMPTFATVHPNNAYGSRTRATETGR